MLGLICMIIYCIGFFITAKLMVRKGEELDTDAKIGMTAICSCWYLIAVGIVLWLMMEGFWKVVTFKGKS